MMQKNKQQEKVSKKVLKFIQNFQTFLYLIAIGLALWVLIFMPSANKFQPISKGEYKENLIKCDFNLYGYLNEAISANGSMIFECFKIRSSTVQHSLFPLWNRTWDVPRRVNDS